jgi:hypothetical protein
LHTAQALASYGVTSKEQRTAIKDACKGTRFTTAFGKILKHLLSCGVGVHHAGMLPRYRLLVEKLAQRGLLPVICGTDTLGVGINVPIHTVLFTALTKFDGSRMRRLRSREFHQIAGRAGRMGYDTEGLVIVEAPEYEIDNARALAKAGNDPKARRRIKRKRPPEGFVNWNEQTLEHLAGSSPEKLLPHLRVTHAMVLAEILQGGDAEARIQKLIFDSGQTDEQKAKLLMRSDEIFATLVDAGVAIRKELPNGETNWSATVDLPEDFALDQPLSPFLLAAIELLDSESDTYALDVISMIEATLENPWSILRAQERRARDAAMAQMKADGIDYDERMERIVDISYPKPLEGLLNAAFESYCEKVPWARDFQLRPKSVLRDMLETANDFKGYISGFGMARSEGTLLRYLSEAYHVLSRTIPADKFDERLKEILEWLDFTVRTVDSSLVDEWAASGEDASVVPPAATDVVVPDRRAVTLLVRNALWRRVRLIAAHDIQQLGKIDYDWGWDKRRWRDALDAFFKAHDHVVLDADAHSTKFFEIDTSEETSKHLWHVRQTVNDYEGDRDFGIWADVLLDATQDLGAAVFDHYRAGFIEDLLGSD